MSRIIATINMTVDGYCDHTAMIADEDIHQHYTRLLNESGGLIYGRVTYQLMESYWPELVKNPGGNKAMNEFAVAIDRIPKIVFSRTLNAVTWKTARLARGSIQEEISALKNEPGEDILVGSPGLIVSLANLHLIDEFQLTVHPVIAGKGLPLFKNLNDRTVLKLIKTKSFTGSGSVTLYYEPGQK